MPAVVLEKLPAGAGDTGRRATSNCLHAQPPTGPPVRKTAAGDDPYRLESCLN
jgi:hypothetical protein